MNTAIQPTQIMPATEEEITIRATAGELVAASKTVVIMTHADLSAATDLVKAIKQRRDEAEEARTKITQPINAGLREINSRFKTITEPLEDAERSVKAKMVQFQDAEERRAREEAARKERERQEQLARERAESERRAREEAAQAADESLDRAPAPPAPVTVAAVAPLPPIEPQIRKTTYGQSGAASTFKKVWDYQVTDLTKVPMQYLMLDSTRVSAAVKAGIREIPGVHIYEKTVAAVK